MFFFSWSFLANSAKSGSPTSVQCHFCLTKDDVSRRERKSSCVFSLPLLTGNQQLIQISIILKIFLLQNWVWQMYVFWKSQFVRPLLPHSWIFYMLKGSCHLPLNFLLCWFIAFISASFILETSIFLCKSVAFWFLLHGLAFCSDLNKVCFQTYMKKISVAAHHPSYLLLITAECYILHHFFPLINELIWFNILK